MYWIEYKRNNTDKYGCNIMEYIGNVIVHEQIRDAIYVTGNTNRKYWYEIHTKVRD